MEKKLRAKLEDELREYREAERLNERRFTNLGDQDVEDLNIKLSQAEEKVLQHFLLDENSRTSSKLLSDKQTNNGTRIFLVQFSDHPIRIRANSMGTTIFRGISNATSGH